MTALPRLARLPAAIVLSALLATALAAEEVPEDRRTAVEMPALQQYLLRQEMVAHTAALHRIIGHLAADELEAAAEVAEEELGLSSMGKHAARTAGRGPGQFMPPPMRAMGIGMHRSASAFAETAKAGDRGAALAALHKVSSACVACHAGYRLVSPSTNASGDTTAPSDGGAAPRAPRPTP